MAEVRLEDGGGPLLQHLAEAPFGQLPELLT
jgi:hypothetical protein